MPKKYSKQLSSIGTNKRQRLTAVIVVVLVAIIGTILLIGSHAASPYTSVTSDHGTLAGAACTQNDTAASDGTAVEFGGSCVCPNSNAVSATLCWNGDFETGSLSQFNVQQCQGPGTASDVNQPTNVSIVTSPVRSGTYAAAIQTNSQTIPANCTNLGSKQHPHVDLQNTTPPDMTDGSDYYIGFSVYVPISFPKDICYPGGANSSCWMQVMEAYGRPYGGSPPIQVEIDGDSSGNGANRLELIGYPDGYPISIAGYTNTHTGNGVIWQSPDITDNVWQDFVLHIHFSSCGGTQDLALYAACSANQSPGFEQLWWGDTSGNHPLARQTFTDSTQTSYFANLMGAPFGLDGCGVNFENAASNGCSNGVVPPIQYTAPTSDIIQFDQYHGAQNMDICPASGSCTNWTPAGTDMLCPTSDAKCVDCTQTGTTCTSCTNDGACISDCTTSSITDTNCYEDPCPPGDSCYSVPDLGPITLYYDQDKIGTTCAAADPSSSNCGQGGSSP